MSNKPIRTILELKPYGCKNEEESFSKLREAKDIVNADLRYWGHKPVEAEYCENGTFEFRNSGKVPDALVKHLQNSIGKTGVVISVIRHKNDDVIN